jgi:amidohydrolase
MATDTTPLREIILQRAKQILPEVIALRRHFHANPELSFREHQTSEFISNYLARLNIPHKTGIAGTGITGYIEGSLRGGKNIALRADMDALPVTEENDIPYRSMNEGVMRACGHDANMSVVLGTAIVLNELRNQLTGKVILIFQPGEELSPGGASLILGSGILENPKPDHVIGIHALPELDSGCVGYRGGKYMASADELHFTVRGKGGHAALPGQTTDQIYIASQLVITLKDAISAEKNRRGIDTGLGIGRFAGLGAGNVIPASVEIKGTLRTFDEEWRAEALDLMASIAENIASRYGVEIIADYKQGYPVLNNDEKLTERAIELSKELLGNERVRHLDTRMGSDDFSFYAREFPSLYFRIGIRNPDQPYGLLHTSTFNLDENALGTGVANLTWLTLNFMDNS